MGTLVQTIPIPQTLSNNSLGHHMTFKTSSVRGFIPVARFNKNGQDLFKCDPASNFANTFMRRYAHKGVKDVAVYAGEDISIVEIHFTLVPYFPNKGNPT